MSRPELYLELGVVVTDYEYNEADPNVGILHPSIEVLGIEIWDGDERIESEFLETYFLLNYKKELEEVATEHYAEKLVESAATDYDNAVAREKECRLDSKNHGIPF